MSYAKQLFTAPMAMLAQAAGAASMPFFASLWSQERRYEFATGVADSVSRVAALGLLAASGMVALGRPMIDLFFTGGRFSSADARECAAYFAVFSVSLFLWSAQAIYARAFYAAGNTFAAHGGGNDCDGGFAAHLCRVLPLAGRDGAGRRFRYGHRAANRDHRRAAA